MIVYRHILEIFSYCEAILASHDSRYNQDPAKRLRWNLLQIEFTAENCGLMYLMLTFTQ